MGARFLSSTGLQSGKPIERAQFFPVPALDKNRSPIQGRQQETRQKTRPELSKSETWVPFVWVRETHRKAAEKRHFSLQHAVRGSATCQMSQFAKLHGNFSGIILRIVQICHLAFQFREYCNAVFELLQCSSRQSCSAACFGIRCPRCSGRA